MAKKKEFDLIDNPEAAVEASLSKVEGFVQNNKEKRRICVFSSFRPCTH